MRFVTPGIIISLFRKLRRNQNVTNHSLVSFCRSIETTVQMASILGGCRENPVCQCPRLLRWLLTSLANHLLVIKRADSLFATGHLFIVRSDSQRRTFLSTVQVCPGTYAEQVFISQALTLEGHHQTSANSSDVVITTPGSGLTIVTDDFGFLVAPMVEVNAAVEIPGNAAIYCVSSVSLPIRR